MMKRRGHEPILRIGARKTSQGALEAHAWVEVFEQPVIGELADLPSYRQFPAFVL